MFCHRYHHFYMAGSQYLFFVFLMWFAVGIWSAHVWPVRCVFDPFENKMLLTYVWYGGCMHSPVTPWLSAGTKRPLGPLLLQKAATTEKNHERSQ